MVYAEKQPKVERDAAELEVDLMLEALGVESPEDADRETLIRTAMDGRLNFDAKSEQGILHLRWPIKLANSEMLSQVSFHQPDGEELEYITAGQRVEVDAAKKSGSMEIGQTVRGTLRFLTKVSGLAIGVAQRMKAGDLKVIEVIAGFFQ